MDKRISHSKILPIIFSFIISPMLVSLCRHMWMHINLHTQNFMFHLNKLLPCTLLYVVLKEQRKEGERWLNIQQVVCAAHESSL